MNRTILFLVLAALLVLAGVVAVLVGVFMVGGLGWTLIVGGLAAIGVGLLAGPS